MEIKIQNNKYKVEHRTDTGMYLRAEKTTYPKFSAGQYSCDVYNVLDDDNIVILVACSTRGMLRQTAVIISIERYDDILNLHDVYNTQPYHWALMSEVGFD